MKQLRNELLKKAGLFLVGLGFDKKIYGQSFRKTIEGGKAFIHLSFINHVDDFDVMVSFGIRFDKMEDMANSINKLITEKEKLNTATIGIELGNYSEGRQKRWTVREENDIAPVVEAISKDIAEIVIPFIEKYKNMNTVFETMLRDDPEVWSLAPFHYKRAINAVGLAKLLNRGDMLDTIIVDKTKFLKDRNDYGLEMFLNFVNTIER